MMAMEPLWEQNEIPLMVDIMRIASTKSQIVRGASNQPALMGSCLTISHTCLPCLPTG